jgi:hypothetical protein
MDSQKIGLTGRTSAVFIKLTNGVAMATNDIEIQDPFERASGWVTNCLMPVLKTLAKVLEEKGYRASVHKHADQTLSLSFSKFANRFEYTLDCLVSPVVMPDWPKGRIDLRCSRRVNYTEDSVPFRDSGSLYDIEDVSGKEIELHFQKTFRRWIVLE